MKRRKNYGWLSVLSVLAVLAAWEIVTDVLHVMPAYMLPSPRTVLDAFLYKLTG